MEDIIIFLESNSFSCRKITHKGLELICCTLFGGKGLRYILPLEIKARTLETAMEAAEQAWRVIESMEEFPLIITEDRWHRQRKTMEARLLAHLEIFCQVFARNCEVRKIEKSEAQTFLEANHSYGYASCKYHYGLFLRRNRPFREGSQPVSALPEGTLVAVATFSNARKWMKDTRVIRSYEWTRYACLPDLRISGGMGKVLRAFIDDTAPDDIMSYADLEWSKGLVYNRLGFIYENMKEPVYFTIDPISWERKAIKNYETEVAQDDLLYFCNFGSGKYRLKLTEYK